LKELDLPMLYRILFGLLFLASTPLSAQFSLGVIGGVGQIGLSGDAPPPTYWGTTFGWGAGLAMEYDVGNDVGITAQPMFESRSSALRVTVPIEGSNPPEDSTFDSAYVRTTNVAIPIGIRVYSGSRRWFFATGATAILMQEAEIDTLNGSYEAPNAIKSIDLMLNVGVGYQIPIDPIRINIELRYSQGLADLVGEDQYQFMTNSPVVRMGGFQALVAAEWRFGQ
jgi:hypothetical protein